MSWPPFTDYLLCARHPVGSWPTRPHLTLRKKTLCRRKQCLYCFAPEKSGTQGYQDLPGVTQQARSVCHQIPCTEPLQLGLLPPPAIGTIVSALANFLMTIFFKRSFYHVTQTSTLQLTLITQAIKLGVRLFCSLKLFMLTLDFFSNS